MKRAHSKSKRHGRGKRFRQDAPNPEGMMQWKPGKPGRTERGQDRDSDSEGENMTSEGMTGVILKMGEASRGRPSGLVSFTLKNGQTAMAEFVEEQTVANDYRLKDMRRYTSNPSLTFPFKVGMPVIIRTYRQFRYAAKVPYLVGIAIGGEEDPKAPIVLEDISGKDITNLDGTSIMGTVTAFNRESGIATFTKDGAPPQLTHFTVRGIKLGGVAVPQSTFKHVIYVGMPIPLTIKSSSSAKIPGIYYTADMTLDIPLTSGEAEEVQEPKEYRAVVLKVAKNGPTVFSCCYKDDQDETKNFFVTCEGATVNNEPTSGSDLYFGEEANVLCSVRFKYKYEELSDSFVYPAVVDMPLKFAKIAKLIFIRGIYFPRTVTATIDGASRQVLINRSSIKVMGKQPEPPFPQQFFKVDMEIPLNDVWVINKKEYRATLNLSKNLVDRALLQQAESVTSDSISASVVDMPKTRFPMKPNTQLGLVSGLRENAEGRVIPSEVKAMIEGEEHKIVIPADQVFINGKTDLYLPASKVALGSKIKVHNLKLREDTKTYEAKLLYFFPKPYMSELFDTPAPTNQK